MTTPPSALRTSLRWLLVTILLLCCTAYLGTATTSFNVPCKRTETIAVDDSSASVLIQGTCHTSTSQLRAPHGSSAVRVTAQSLTIRNIAIEGGTAQKGGCIFVQAQEFSMVNASVSQCSASQLGAGIYLEGTPGYSFTANIAFVTFADILIRSSFSLKEQGEVGGAALFITHSSSNNTTNQVDLSHLTVEGAVTLMELQDVPKTSSPEPGFCPSSVWMHDDREGVGHKYGYAKTVGGAVIVNISSASHSQSVVIIDNLSMENVSSAASGTPDVATSTALWANATLTTGVSVTINDVEETESQSSPHFRPGIQRQE